MIEDPAEEATDRRWPILLDHLTFDVRAFLMLERLRSIAPT